jgi:hypothetical protein
MPRDLFSRLKLATKIMLRGELHATSQRNDIPAISAEEIAEIKQFFALEKYFVFGHARSGTTLLARLLRVHPEVHCNWQGHFFTRSPFLQALVSDPQVGSWLSRRSNRWNHGKDLSPFVLRGVCDLVMEREARQVNKRIVGDKSPNSLVDGEAVRLMNKVYPDARLIYIVRDGRDAVLSHRFQRFIDATQHLTPEDISLREAFIKDPQPFLRGERSIFTRKGIHLAAQGWVRNVGETDQAGKEIFKAHYLSLRFEDLIQQPWNELSRVWVFLGVDLEHPNLKEALKVEMSRNPDADWQQEKASEIAQPLHKGRTGSWREIFTPYDRQVFLDIAAQTLNAWGYPLD